MFKLNKIQDFLDTHPIGRVFNLGGKDVVWKKVTELKAGMKIAIADSSDGGPEGLLRGGRVKFDEVVSIKKVGRERVWDIEVEGTHNFIGNGIVAHNTYISSDLEVAGTTGLTLSGAGGDITFANLEKIDNDTDGTIAITAATTALSGNLKLSGGNILNSAGTAAISLSGTPTTAASVLSASNWLVENPATGNLGQAALMVNQTKAGDLFTASASGTPKFVITNAGNVGIGTTNPSTALQVSGTVTATAFSGNLTGNTYSSTAVATTPTTMGWYRVAVSASGVGRNSATFEILTTNNHSRSIFNVGQMYMNGGTINQLHYTTYNGLGVTRARIVYHPSLYSGEYAYVEVYKNSSEVEAITCNIINSVGWTSVAPNTAGSIPAGYTTKELVFTTGMASTGDFNVAGNVGIGTAGPLSKLSVGGVGNANYAIYGTGAIGVYGDGVTGVYGIGTGVFGSSTGTSTGVVGNNTGTGYGVRGINSSTGVGGYFTSSSGYALITGAGKVGIGTAGPLSKLSVGGDGSASYVIYGTSASAGSYGVYGSGVAYGVYGTGGTGVYGYNATSGEGVFGVNDGTGYGVRATNNSTGYALYCYATAANKCGGNQAWYNASDRKLKENIAPINNALAKVLNLQGVTFNLKNDPSKTPQMGFIAQDVLPYVPEVVGFDESNDYWGMQTSQLTALLVNAMQEQQGQIATSNVAIASLSGQLAELKLTDSGDLEIVAAGVPPSEESFGHLGGGTHYTLQTAAGEIIQRVGAFAQVVAANIKAGAIETQDFVTGSFTAFQATIDNLLITGGLVSPVVQTSLISPLADESDVVIRLGRNTSGESKATPDVLDASEESYGKLIIQNPQGEEVASIDSSGSAEFRSASVSGELYAESIVSPDLDKIQELLRQVEADQKLLTDAKTWNTSSASDSASLDQIAVSDLFVTNQAAINSLSVLNSFAIGTDFVINTTSGESPSTSLGTSIPTPDVSINTLTSPLKLQSLALAPVEIMAGKVRIDTDGNMIITGNLAIAGDLEVGGKTKLKEVELERLVIAQPDTSGESITATPEVGVNPGEIQTNATAGKAIIPAGTTEITIKNPKITDYTLVYITPLSSTQNKVLYVKSKSSGFFTVGFTDALDTDVEFNWWVIDVTQ